MDGADLEVFERSLRNATDRHTGGPLDAALAELGWHDALTVDPEAAISTLFGLQGAANVTSSALGHVLAHALGLEATAGPGVVLPTIGRWDPPGTLEDGLLRVDGLATAALADRESAVVVASTRDGVRVVTVATSSLEVRRVAGVDPGLGLLQVTGASLPVTADPASPPGGWVPAVTFGRLATAHELVGASRTMLELARQHALGRIQFGQPISSFQAVRHRLAETLVAIEMADAMLDAAWLDGSSGSAAMAKAVAGRQARTTARHCQQVLAGIGFTDEHPLHLYIRRVLVLDGLFGTAAAITKSLGDELIAGGRLPPLVPL